MEKIKIKKLNEVYIQLDCEQHISHELSEHFKFKVPGYQFTPAFKKRYWSGDIFLYNMKNNTIYYGLLPYIEKLCKERNYKIEYLDDFSSNDFSIKELENFIKSLELTLVPRDYQIESLFSCIKDNRKLLLSPTSSGKSLIIYLLCRYYNLKTLIIVPTTSLVHQMYSDFETYGYNVEDNMHKIYEGQSSNSDKSIILSTWQSIYKQDKSWFNQFDVVIGDESHLFKSKSLTSIMIKLENCKYRFGFTGTLDGSQTNKLVLEGLFGAVKQIVTTSELIKQKHLADFSIKNIILTYPDNIKKQVYSMDFQSEIDFIVRMPERNRFISNLAISLKGNSLLLFQYVEKHGKVLYDMISSEVKDRKVFFIHGNVDSIEREQIRKIIETEKNAIIVASFGTCSTGINIKNLHNIIFCSPSKSRIRNLQSIGRGLRKSETKTSSVLYDIADDLSWKNKQNYTLLHYIERLKIYNEEQFNYKIYKVPLSYNSP